MIVNQPRIPGCTHTPWQRYRDNDGYLVCYGCGLMEPRKSKSIYLPLMVGALALLGVTGLLISLGAFVTLFLPPDPEVAKMTGMGLAVIRLLDGFITVLIVGGVISGVKLLGECILGVD